jgi:hypothetical protein
VTGEHTTWPDGQRQVLQHRWVVPVAHPHVLELDAAGSARRAFAREQIVPLGLRLDQEETDKDHERGQELEFLTALRDRRSSTLASFDGGGDERHVSGAAAVAPLSAKGEPSEPSQTALLTVTSLLMMALLLLLLTLSPLLLLSAVSMSGSRGAWHSELSCGICKYSNRRSTEVMWLPTSIVT